MRSALRSASITSACAGRRRHQRHRADAAAGVQRAAVGQPPARRRTAALRAAARRRFVPVGQVFGRGQAQHRLTQQATRRARAAWPPGIGGQHTLVGQAHQPGGMGQPSSRRPRPRSLRVPARPLRGCHAAKRLGWAGAPAARSNTAHAAAGPGSPAPGGSLAGRRLRRMPRSGWLLQVQQQAPRARHLRCRAPAHAASAGGWN
jgi:hypothetical protein